MVINMPSGSNGAVVPELIIPPKDRDDNLERFGIRSGHQSKADTKNSAKQIVNPFQFGKNTWMRHLTMDVQLL